jgi:uncharacterized protein (DUF433 family)
MNVPLPTLREFVRILRDEFGVPYPLAHQRPFVGSGRQLVVRAQEQSGIAAIRPLYHVLTNGQVLLDGPAETFLSEMVFAQTDGQTAERWYPLGRQSAVVVDPELSAGRPNVHGVRTEAILELVEALEPKETIAEDFRLTVADVEAAVAFEYKTRLKAA